MIRVKILQPRFQSNHAITQNSMPLPSMVASFCCYNTRYHTICSWTCHIYLDTNFIVGVFLVLINLFRKGLLWCFPLIQAKNSIKFKLFSKLYQKTSATHAIFVAWHFCFLLQGSANFIIENLFYDFVEQKFETKNPSKIGIF